MKTIAIIFFTLLNLITCNVKPGKYKLAEIENTAYKLKIPKEKSFYLDPFLIKKEYPRLKFTINSSTVKIITNNLEFLNTGTEKCSVGNLNQTKRFDALPIIKNSKNQLKNLKMYPNVIKAIKKKKFTLLFFWSKRSPFKINKNDVEYAKEQLHLKCDDDCQILYLNSDIYEELYTQLKKIKEQKNK